MNAQQLEPEGKNIMQTIAVIPGDGVGPEVIDEALRVLQRVSEVDGVGPAATKSLAIEYAKRGVRMNAVSPGVIKTPMHTPDSYDFLGSIHPMGRMGEISDVVDAVLYLEKAPYVTGEILHVDGGQAAGL